MTAETNNSLIRTAGCPVAPFTRLLLARDRNLSFYRRGVAFSYGPMRKEVVWCILPAQVRTREASGFWSARALRPTHQSMTTPSDLLLDHLKLIERIIGNLCRGTMDASQMEEFFGFVQLRLIENEYSIIRAFQGRSSFGTYLTTVVARLLNDYRNHEWGKWHDSAEAKRQGDLAVELERLIGRDKRSIDEALVILQRKYSGVTKEMLEQLAERFPTRYGRRMVGLDQRPEPSVAGTGDALANRETAARASEVVSAFIAQLPKEDQLLFQLRFEGDMPVPQIANSLKQDAQRLYRRLQSHFGNLRGKLEDAGVSAADVARLMGSDSVLDFKRKSGGRRPSKDEDPGGKPEEDA
jgi:RNA polymerase sigma factor (sigma-70 family)